MGRSKSQARSKRISRRHFNKGACLLGASAAAAGAGLVRGVADDDPPRTPFSWTPFNQELPIPQDHVPLPGTLASPPFTPGAVHHGIAPEWIANPTQYEKIPTKFFEMRIQDTVHEIIPGVKTPMVGYTTDPTATASTKKGLVPGPTFRARLGEPFIVRQFNDTATNKSTHLHGGHTPAHSDGHPFFFILPGKARDYYYPNIAPLDAGGKFDITEAPSTMWYHDHAMDITAENVLHGLAGFYILTDDLEQGLINKEVLPEAKFDIPLVLSDIRLEKSGKIFFDPLDHNGYLGDIQPVNGVVQPFLRVERRKYRFRILFGSNARWFLLRLSTGGTVSLPSKSKSKSKRRRRRSSPPAAVPMLQIANDSWLLPEAIPINEAMGWPAHRVDLIIDFTNAPKVVYLENVFEQEDGRGPEGDLFEPDIMAGVKLLKFIVSDETVVSDVSVTSGTKLRPHHEITSSEIVKTRKFEFDKDSGAWVINDKFFNPYRADATPTLGTAERWILENDGGNWWHPIHIHLESHQVVRIEGRVPPPHLRHKSDTTPLGGDTLAEIYMRFRTFTGPFVFHCHNVEHEDMRMMFNVDPHVTPTRSPQPIQGRFF